MQLENAGYEGMGFFVFVLMVYIHNPKIKNPTNLKHIQSLLFPMRFFGFNYFTII